MSKFTVTSTSNAPDAWKAFDNKTDTSWSSSDASGQLTFDFGVPTSVKGVRFTPSATNLTAFPTMVVLEGSNADGNVTTIQTFTLSTPVAGIPQSFTFASPVKYSTYIFKPTGSTNVTIAEIEFLVSKDVIIPQPKLQEKMITPSAIVQTITPDAGYDGLSKVVVDAVPEVELPTIMPTNSSWWSPKMVSNIRPSYAYPSTTPSSNDAWLMFDNKLDTEFTLNDFSQIINVRFYAPFKFWGVRIFPSSDSNKVNDCPKVITVEVTDNEDSFVEDTWTIAYTNAETVSSESVPVAGKGRDYFFDKPHVCTKLRITVSSSWGGESCTIGDIQFCKVDEVGKWWSPKMTSDNTPEPYVIDDPNTNDHLAYLVFDGNKDTVKELAFRGLSSTPGVETDWGSNLIFGGVRVYCPSDEEKAANFIKDIRLACSTDPHPGSFVWRFDSKTDYGPIEGVAPGGYFECRFSNPITARKMWVAFNQDNHETCYVSDIEFYLVTGFAETTMVTGGLDTSDATAGPEDILFGKTAYVNGKKIVGTHVDPPKGYSWWSPEMTSATAPYTLTYYPNTTETSKADAWKVFDGSQTTGTLLESTSYVGIGIKFDKDLTIAGIKIAPLTTNLGKCPKRFDVFYRRDSMNMGAAAGITDPNDSGPKSGESREFFFDPKTSNEWEIGYPFMGTDVTWDGSNCKMMALSEIQFYVKNSDLGLPD